LVNPAKRATLKEAKYVGYPGQDSFLHITKEERKEHVTGKYYVCVMAQMTSSFKILVRETEPN